MTQTIRITITPDFKKALDVLRRSTSGTLNTTELIKMAVGSFAQVKHKEMTAKELDSISSQLFHTWSKEDDTLGVDNIAHPEELKPFTPKTYV